MKKNQPYNVKNGNFIPSLDFRMMLNEKKKLFLSSFLLIVFWLLSWIFAMLNNTVNNNDNLHKQIQKHFLYQEETMSDVLQLLIQNNNVTSRFPDILNELYQSHPQARNVAFYLFVDSVLVWWSDCSIPIQDAEMEIQSTNNELVLLSNGYYYCKSISDGQVLISALLPVFFRYPIQNTALKNGFATHWDISLPVNFSLDNNLTQTIVNSENDFVFSFDVISEGQAGTIPFVYIFILFLAGYGILMFLIFQLLQKLALSKFVFLLLYFFIIFSVRILQIKFAIPGFLYSHLFFSPVHYAWNAWFASIGDLILNLFVVLCSGIFIYVQFERVVRFYTNKFKRLALLFGFPLILLVLYFSMLFLLESLIINSTLILSIDDVLKLKWPDITGFLIILFMLPTFLFVAYVIFQQLRKNLRLKYDKIFCFVTLCTIICSVILLFPRFAYSLFLFFPYFTAVLLLKKTHFKVAGNYGLLTVLLFAFGFGIVMNKANRTKEEGFRKLYAIQLSNEQDPIGEFLFEEISEKIQTDTAFFEQVLLSPEQQQFAAEYLKRNYLGGYFSKYQIQVTVCTSDEILRIMPSNTEFPCRPFFETLKTQFGTPTFVKNFWLIDDETGRPNYLYEMQYSHPVDGHIDTLLLYLEMITIPGIKILGYPELLVEEKVMKKSDRYDYAYAKYFKGELVNQSGNYIYPMFLNNSASGNEIYFFEKNGFSHLLYPVNDKTTIIVSLPQKRFFENIATFSYLLIFLILFHYLFFFIMQAMINRPVFSSFTFQSRLQIAAVFLVILCFVVAGIISVTFYIRYNTNKNEEIIREKSFSLMVELEHKLRNFEKFSDEDTDYLNELMLKFSNVFFTDINLFSTTGKLIATSRPQIYQQGLTSTYMNPVALKTLQESGMPYILNQEFIGKLHYISSYLPFRNYQNEVIAYLNLPYFARENELRQEISSFLIAIINFYVVLIVLAIIVALAVAGYLTLPLKIIAEKLRVLKPGQPNEKIVWNKNDEIGLLVEEYNRMIDMLAARTQQLMKSERESAWREMAKQIAHEIKNPLTPMKLSLQNLQRAWNDKASDYEERLKRTSQTLIEQIDALSKIATDFANFAQMRETSLYPVDIIRVILDVMHLYQSENIDIDLQYDKTDSYIIMADETQIIQIFNNLLKNAVQAIPHDKTGSIIIRVEKKERSIFVHVEDNGIGIPDDIKHKIFSPNFTSKSGGTGLGLAITKKIVDTLGGNITFTSELNKGSIFTVRFPCFIQE